MQDGMHPVTACTIPLCGDPERFEAATSTSANMIIADGGRPCSANERTRDFWCNLRRGNAANTSLKTKAKQDLSLGGRKRKRTRGRAAQTKVWMVQSGSEKTHNGSLLLFPVQAVLQP